MSVKKTARPLSPHLGIYKPQLTSGMSIFHRATGVALAFGLPVFVAWLVVLAGGQEAYDSFISLFQNIYAQIILGGLSFAFFYHFFCGIRHLLWDAGFFLDLQAVYGTGYVTLLLAFGSTAYVWLKLYGYVP